MTEQEIPMRFPLAGIDLSGRFSQQKPRQMPDGDYARTTPVGQNVRSFEPTSERARGGSRPGLAKYLDQPVGGIQDWIVQDLNLIVTVQ